MHLVCQMAQYAMDLSGPPLGLENISTQQRSHNRGNTNCIVGSILAPCCLLKCLLVLSDLLKRQKRQKLLVWPIWFTMVNICVDEHFAYFALKNVFNLCLWTLAPINRRVQFPPFLLVPFLSIWPSLLTPECPSHLPAIQFCLYCIRACGSYCYMLGPETVLSHVI